MALTAKEHLRRRQVSASLKCCHKARNLTYRQLAEKAGVEYDEVIRYSQRGYTEDAALRDKILAALGVADEAALVTDFPAVALTEEGAERRQEVMVALKAVRKSLKITRKAFVEKAAVPPACMEAYESNGALGNAVARDAILKALGCADEDELLAKAADLGNVGWQKRAKGLLNESRTGAERF
jgi:transcriptional regulator with XRE-family HTH domain